MTRFSGPPFEPLDLTLPEVLDEAHEGSFIDGDPEVTLTRSYVHRLP